MPRDFTRQPLFNGLCKVVVGFTLPPIEAASYIDAVKGALPDNLAGLMDLLPVLRTGEAIIAGEAARLPMRCRITLPPKDQRPRSSDPEVSEAWSKAKRKEGYERVIASWRAQSTIAVASTIKIKRTPVKPEEA